MFSIPKWSSDKDWFGIPSLDRYYESRGAEPVLCDKEKLLSEGYYVLQAPLYSKRITPTLRHDARRLARAVMFIYRKLKKLN